MATGAAGKDERLLFSVIESHLLQAEENLLSEVAERLLLLDRQRASLRSTQAAFARLQANKGASLHFCLTLAQDATIVDIDAACAIRLGESAASLAGRRFSMFFVAEERENWSRAFANAFAGDSPLSGEHVLQLADGSVLDIRLDGLLLLDGRGGKVLRVVITDISEFKRLEHEVRAQLGAPEKLGVVPTDDWLRGIVEQSLAGIYLIQDGYFVYANQGFADIFGYGSSAEIVGKLSVGEFIAPEERAKVAENIRRRMQGEVPEMRYSFIGLHKDGHAIVVEVHGRRMEFEGKPAVIGVILDITERKRAEEQMRIAATAFESHEGMFVTDVGRVVLRVNEAFGQITGYLPEDVVGQPLEVFHSATHDDLFCAEVWMRVDTTGSWHGEICGQRKSGELYPEWLSLATVKDSEGQISHYVGTIADMTERKAAEAEIEYLAFYDQLTRLPNRRLLLDRLQQAIAASTRNGAEGALLIIDLDNFKDLNDTLGHDKGDMLLKLVAERLTSCVRHGDTVARLGGDEFVMMLEGLSQRPDEAAAQSKRIGETILNLLNQPYPLANREYHSTPSIGVTLFSDQQHSVDELLKRADLAMYKAKEAGRNTLRFFDPDMQAAVAARTAIEADLRIGLREGQFIVYYQPQVGICGELTGVEALVRWNRPQRGLIAPGEFISIAESSGLILPLGRWVLETACRQLVVWASDPATKHLDMAVNVSARQFHHAEFVRSVLDVLEATGANPSRLKLELTESLLLADVDDVINKMELLKQRGVGFSLDDFGTGYSSLSYLKRLPLDQLKIDQSFVRGIVTSEDDAAITSTIVALAKNLGLSVIAEGVETEEQLALLAGQGCHAYQGYLFGRPDVVTSLDRLLVR